MSALNSNELGTEILEFLSLTSGNKVGSLALNGNLFCCASKTNVL
jgi:hypothetical protein